MFTCNFICLRNKFVTLKEIKNALICVHVISFVANISGRWFNMSAV